MYILMSTVTNEYLPATFGNIWILETRKTSPQMIKLAADSNSAPQITLGSIFLL